MNGGLIHQGEFFLHYRLLKALAHYLDHDFFTEPVAKTLAHNL